MKLILAYMVSHLVCIFCAFNLPFCFFQTLQDFVDGAKSQVEFVSQLFEEVVISLTIFFGRLCTGIKGYKDDIICLWTG